MIYIEYEGKTIKFINKDLLVTFFYFFFLLYVGTPSLVGERHYVGLKTDEDHFGEVF